MIKENLDLKVREDKSNFEQATALTETKLLLQADESEDLNFMQNAFPRSANTRTLERNADAVSIKELEESHDGNVYTSEQLKSICLKYKLRFLPTTKYKGSVPANVVSEVRKKLEKTDGLKYLSSGSSHLYGRKLFIMAPAQMFNIKSVSSKKKAELAEIKRLRNLDPAIFVEVEEDKYLFLKEFGNSFSPFRRVLGALTAKASTLNTLFFTAWLAFIALGVFTFLHFNAMFPLAKDASGSEYISNVNCLFTTCYMILFIFFAVAWISRGEFSFFLAGIKEREKGFWRVDKRFATENNWNQH